MYFKIVSNFTRLTAPEITYNNFEVSLVVFTPTTNHAITYTNYTLAYFVSLKLSKSAATVHVGFVLKTKTKSTDKCISLLCFIHFILVCFFFLLVAFFNLFSISPSTVNYRFWGPSTNEMMTGFFLVYHLVWLLFVFQCTAVHHGFLYFVV